MDGEISHVLEGDNNSYFFAGIERERERERGTVAESRGAWHALVWLTEL
jgi:hypothetical protein